MPFMQLMLLHVFQSMAYFNELVRRQLVSAEAYEAREPGL